MSDILSPMAPTMQDKIDAERYRFLRSLATDLRRLEAFVACSQLDFMRGQKSFDDCIDKAQADGPELALKRVT